MASGKVSPRQKMINMMYLVLTALLALNISKDMLKAFAKVNNSLKSNLVNINNHSTEVYTSFEESAENSPDKVGAAWQLAQGVKSHAEEVRYFISELKDLLITNTGGYKEGTDKLASADNKSKVSHTMLMKPELMGEKFRMKLDSFRIYLNSLEVVHTVEELEYIVDHNFDTKEIMKDGLPVSWEEGTFNNVPLIAVLTFLTQYQVDCSTIESKIVDALYSSVSADDMKFTTAVAQVLAPKNYIMEGDSFRAEISIAAFDTTQAPEILVTKIFNEDGSPDFSQSDTVDVSNRGVGDYNVVARGLGVQKRATRILLTTEKGIEEFDETFEFQVAKPMAVVSPTKMNVFYRGVPNPIDVSAPGFSPEDLAVSGSNVRIKKIKAGQYEASVIDKAKGNAKITVKANSRTIGKPIEFRLSKIPPPIAYINGRNDGKMARGKLSKAQGVVARLKDFPFDLKYTVISFDVRLKDGEYTSTIKCKGNKFNPEVREKILKLKPGSDVSFTNIKAKGPDGKKSCGAIVLTVQ
jgi:gliding motility-associated protein GldM